MRWAGRFTVLFAAVSLSACGSKQGGGPAGEEGGHWVNESGGTSFGGTSGGTGGRSATGGVRTGGSGSGGRPTGGAGDAGNSTGGLDSGGSDPGGSSPGGSATGGSDPGGSSSGGSATSGSDSGGAPTGGTQTGGTPTGGTPTGGAATGGSGGAVACEPTSMTGWQAPAYVPARHTADACRDDEIQAYYRQCFWAFGTEKDCTPFETGGPSAGCGACLSPSALQSSPWGPVLAIEPAVYLYESNVAGCIEILEGNPTCAARIQAADACARAACIDVCATDRINAQAYQDCARQARIGVCKPYVDQTTTCISSAAIQAACSGTGFEALFLALGKVFCGSG